MPDFVKDGHETSDNMILWWLKDAETGRNTFVIKKVSSSKPDAMTMSYGGIMSHKDAVLR